MGATVAQGVREEIRGMEGTVAQGVQEEIPGMQGTVAQVVGSTTLLVFTICLLTNFLQVLALRTSLWVKSRAYSARNHQAGTLLPMGRAQAITERGIVLTIPLAFIRRLTARLRYLQWAHH